MAKVDNEPKWYILHTYSGYEAIVKEDLLRLIENNNLQDSIVDVKIPTEQTIEEKANGKKKVVERKLLPCYVFIKMVYSNQLWYLVTNTRGVTGFCGPQGRPIPMKEDEIRKMRLEEYVVDADFKAGDRVSIRTPRSNTVRCRRALPTRWKFPARKRNKSDSEGARAPEDITWERR